MTPPTSQDELVFIPLSEPAPVPLALPYTYLTLPGATQTLQVFVASGRQDQPASQVAIPGERVDALMDWLRSDSLDWDAVERARSDAWR